MSTELFEVCEIQFKTHLGNSKKFPHYNYTFNQNYLCSFTKMMLKHKEVSRVISVFFMPNKIIFDNEFIEH